MTLSHLYGFKSHVHHETIVVLYRIQELYVQQTKKAKQGQKKERDKETGSQDKDIGTPGSFSQTQDKEIGTPGSFTQTQDKEVGTPGSLTQGEEDVKVCNTLSPSQGTVSPSSTDGCLSVFLSDFSSEVVSSNPSPAIYLTWRSVVTVMFLNFWTDRSEQTV